jgi:hypothetical protein
VANLETQARRHEQLIRHHELTIWDLKQLLSLASDFTKVKEEYPRDLMNMQSSIDSVVNPILMCLSQLLEQHPTPAPAPCFFSEPPFHSVSLRDAKNKVLLATHGAKIWKGSFTRGSHGEMG